MIRNQASIGDVARQIGVNPWTLRRLEQLGRIPSARRDPLCGQRVYTAEDIECIRVALAQIGEGRATTTAP